MLVLLTTVDLRTIMYAPWPANICLESTSLPPKGFQNVLLIPIYNYIYLLLSSFSVQMQVVRRSLLLSITTIYYQVLCDKKKEPAMFWPVNFPHLPKKFT